MGKLVVKLTFAGTIFVVSQWLAIHLVDFIVWFLDADKTGIYQKNQKTFDLVYDVVIPYFVAAFITIKYIAKVFFIPTPRVHKIFNYIRNINLGVDNS